MEDSRKVAENIEKMSIADREEYFKKVELEHLTWTAQEKLRELCDDFEYLNIDHPSFLCIDYKKLASQYMEKRSADIPADETWDEIFYENVKEIKKEKVFRAEEKRQFKEQVAEMLKKQHEPVDEYTDKEYNDMLQSFKANDSSDVAASKTIKTTVEDQIRIHRKEHKKY